MSIALQDSGLLILDFAALHFSLRRLETQLLSATGVDYILHRLTNMGFTTLLCQLDLPLALGIALHLIRCVLIATVMTAYALLLVLTFLVLLCNRHATGVALIVSTLFKLVIYRNPIVKNEALSLPFTL